MRMIILFIVEIKSFKSGGESWPVGTDTPIRFFIKGVGAFVLLQKLGEHYCFGYCYCGRRTNLLIPVGVWRTIFGDQRLR